MKKLYTVILFLILTILIKPNISKSTINSIILTPANPTILSTGLGYYLAGRTYNFSVQVIDPDAAGWANIKLVRLFIPNTTNIDIQIGALLVEDPPTTGLTGTGAQTVYIRTGAATITVVSANIPITDTPNNFTVTFSIRFLWNVAADSAWAANRQIQAMAVSNFPVAPVLGMPAPPTFLPTTAPYLLATQNVSYGVSSSIKILNFAQTGVAAGGYVNQYHTGFNVTGTIVYNVPGADIADDINNITNDMTSSAGTNLSLLLNGVASGINFTPAAGSTSFSFIVPGATVTGLGSNNWRVTATMNAVFGGGSSTSPGAGNYLLLNCDEVQINQVQFFNGGGIDNPSNLGVSTSRTYYRAKNLPGTQIRVYAQMLSGPNVIGNTTVRVRDITEGLNYDVIIPNNTAYGDLPLGLVYGTDNNYPNTPAAGGNTLLHTYQVINISGGATGNEQNAYGRINQPGRPTPGGANTAVYWNYLHWPGTSANPGLGIAFNNGAASNAGVTATSTVETFTLTWTNTSLTGANLPFNGDFASYRIYYRNSLVTPLYTMVDRYTTGYAAANLDQIATNTVTIGITGAFLAPLTAYDYKLSAYDVFGNEVATSVILANSNQSYGSISTTASSVFVSITDGITEYLYTTFTVSGQPSWSTLPAVHPVRKSAIKITVKIVTGGNIPEEVAILFNNNNTDTADSGAPFFKPQGASGAFNDIISTTYDTLVCSKSAPNVWSVYIPSTHALMTVGTAIRFIVRTKYGGAYSYVDHKSYNSALNPAPGNWSDAEWRFLVASEPTFTPWPVRILNNVMNAENPVCYPAYYLTDDAYVTISVFDVKGRPVVTLLDNQLRKGGQNIKEGGWDGSNKATRKIGVGIYYVRFYATRAADGKVILNEFRKVVMAR